MGRARAGLSPSTRIGYRHWLDARVLPHFGRKRISSVTTADVERWFGKLRDGPQPLGIRSIRGCRTVLSAMFTTTVRWGYLPSSPVERARVPRAPKWTPRSPEPEQVALRIAAADARDPDLGLFARMAVVTGARRGELAALRWTDIDMVGGLVHIRGAIVSDDESGTGLRRGGRVTTKDTKTHAERTVAIDTATTQALRSMRSRHVEDALACGVTYPADAYLFRGNVGGSTPRPPDRFSYDWIQVDKAVDDGARCAAARPAPLPRHDAGRCGCTTALSPRPPRPLERDRHRHLCRRPLGVGPRSRPDHGQDSRRAWRHSMTEA